jgi:UDP-N-acetylglucosamine 1-carboxyvinyltransferase
MAMATGTGMVTESVWENRFQYVNELKRLGCEITVEGRVAITNGPSNLTGAEVSASDLRAGASLVLAGLASKGTTVIINAKNIHRGYESIESKLQALGADIYLVNEERINIEQPLIFEQKDKVI